MTAVCVGAPLLDLVRHEGVARSGDAQSSAFRSLQGRLRRLKEGSHPVGTLLLELANRSLRRLLFALAGIGLAFAAAAVLVRNIAQPIRAMALAAGRIEKCDLDVQVPEDRIDEVGELARAINQMTPGTRGA